MKNLAELSLRFARETAPAWATDADIRLMADKWRKKIIDDGFFKCVGFNDKGTPIYLRTDKKF